MPSVRKPMKSPVMTRHNITLIFAEYQVGINLQPGWHGLRLTRGLVVIRLADPACVEDAL